MTCCICGRPIAGKAVSLSGRGKAHRKCFEKEKEDGLQNMSKNGLAHVPPG